MIARWVIDVDPLGRRGVARSSRPTRPGGIGMIAGIFMPAPGRRRAGPVDRVRRALVTGGGRRKLRRPRPPPRAAGHGRCSIGWATPSTSSTPPPSAGRVACRGSSPWSWATRFRSPSRGRWPSAFAVLVFPLALLGALLENTPLGVVSPAALGTLLSARGRGCCSTWRRVCSAPPRPPRAWVSFGRARSALAGAPLVDHGCRVPLHASARPPGLVDVGRGAR